MKKYDLTKQELDELRFVGRQVAEHEFLNKIYIDRFNGTVFTVLKRLGLSPEELDKQNKRLNTDLINGVLEVIDAPRNDSAIKEQSEDRSPLGK